MSEGVDWLPPLVLIEDHDGDWEQYEIALYEVFTHDFVNNKSIFKEQQVRHRRYPLSKGKEATFWHLISDGKEEETRIIDFERCKRIRWPKPIIENGTSQKIRYWSERIRRQLCHHIALNDFSYLVVLTERREYILLLAAYCIETPHRRRKLEERWQNATNS